MEGQQQLKWPDDYLNIKCVIYSFYVALSYWLVPKERHDMLLLVNFLLASWYNARYDCAHNVWYLNAAIALLQTSVSYSLPSKNKYALIALLYFPYLVLAWYDFLLRCKFRMNPTEFPYGRWIYLPFKPSNYKEKFENIDPAVLKNIKAVDKYATIFILTGVSFYVASRF